MSYVIGFIIGVIFMMVLRTILYRINKIAWEARMRQMEDEELLKQYKENG
jgi:hypothetical protein